VLGENLSGGIAITYHPRYLLVLNVPSPRDFGIGADLSNEARVLLEIQGMRT
jgi:hypothetical protein